MTITVPASLHVKHVVVVRLQVNQIGLYGGFIGNYEEAVEVVRRCAHSDHRFRTLAEVRQTSRGAPAVTRLSSDFLSLLSRA